MAVCYRTAWSDRISGPHLVSPPDLTVAPTLEPAEAHAPRRELGVSFGVAVGSRFRGRFRVRDRVRVRYRGQGRGLALTSRLSYFIV